MSKEISVIHQEFISTSIENKIESQTTPPETNQTEPSVSIVKSDKKRRGKAPLFCSCRLILSVVSCVGFVNIYILRFNLTVAMVWMVNNTAVEEVEQPMNRPFRPQTCSSTEHIVVYSRPIASDQQHSQISSNEGVFVWTGTQQFILSSSFFLGYFVTQIPGGWLSERYGGKHFYGFSILGCAVVTLFIPVVARASYKALIVTRIILGFFQGPAWPAMFVIWSRWAPPFERQKLTSLCYCGSFLGVAITFPGTSILCEEYTHTGWPSVFYLSETAALRSAGLKSIDKINASIHEVHKIKLKWCAGVFVFDEDKNSTTASQRACRGLGIVFFFVWTYLVYDSPEQHPRISKAEKRYICNSLRTSINMSLKNHDPTPWKAMLNSKTVWGLVFVHMISNFSGFTMISSIAKYMKEALYYHNAEFWNFAAFPYIGVFLVGVVSAMFHDKIVAKKWCSRTVARKAGNTIGMFLPGVLIIIASVFDCTNRFTIVWILLLCLTLCGFQYGSGFMMNVMDLAPQHIGVLFGLSNTFASLSGILGPLLVNQMTADHLPQQWQYVLFMLSGFFLLGSAIYIILGSGDLQEWARLSHEDDAITYVSGDVLS